VALGAPTPMSPATVPTPLTYAPPPAVAPPPPPVDPGPNGWGPYEAPSAPPGYFFDLEIYFLFPALKDRITNDAPVLPSGNQLRVPAASLDFTVSPRIEFGYRLPDSAGLFALSYRFTTTSGNGTTTLDGVPFDVHTRLDVQTIDLDYGTTPFEIAPSYKIDWRVGIRASYVFFDSQINNAALTQQASNHFLGTGPHARLDVERCIAAVPGLSLFGRIDGAILLGQIRQNFREDALQADGTILESTGEARKTQAVPNLTLQAGLSYVPPIYTNFKLTVGYQFEQYWYIGQFGFNDQGTLSSSRGELWSHGAFVRGELDF
jgi:hypothetical protein